MKKARKSSEQQLVMQDVSVVAKKLAKKLSTENLATVPEEIWDKVKVAMDHQFDGAWYGVQKHTIVGMVRKTRKKLGFGDDINTVEKIYAGMTDSNRHFLQCSSWFPHPTDPANAMGMMAFGNPSLVFGLRKYPHLDLYVDATFSCCLAPFKQCYHGVYHATSAYLPVLYILMTHKMSSDQH